MLVLVLLAGALLGASPKGLAASDSAADFFLGKTITLYIGGEAGGGYDLFMRTLARHITPHIPGGPAVLPVNMPGASSMILGNYLARVAPRDGSVIGAVNPLLLFEALFSGAHSMAQFRGPEMTMIGNGATAHWVLLTRHSEAITSVTDLKYKDLVVGTTARPGASYILTHAIQKIFDLSHLKIVSGYAGIREVAGAVDRGELSGCVMDIEDLMVLRPQWLRETSMDIIAELSPRDVAGGVNRAPSIRELAANDEDKHVLDVIFASTTLSRPLIAPPQLPPSRTESLRDGFLAAFSDPVFLAEMAVMKIAPSPTSGKRMEEMIGAAYDVSPELLARLHAVLGD